MKKTTIACITMLLLAACNSKNTESATPTPESVFETVSVKKNISFDLKGDANFHPGESSYCSNEVYMFYPKSINGVADKALSDSIKSAMFPGDSTSTDIREAVDRFIDNYDYAPDEVENIKPANKLPESGRFTSTHAVKMAPMSVSKRSMVFQVLHYDYMDGAAHGYSYSRFINYDIESRKVVSISDLFNTNGDKFREMVANQLLAQNNVESFDQLKEKGFLVDFSEFYVTDNFYIDSDNCRIVLVYNPYEIGCYALGKVEISIYAYDFESVITPLGKELTEYNY